MHFFLSRYECFCGKFSNFAAKQPLTMEQKFGKNSIDIEALRDFCERQDHQHDPKGYHFRQ